MIPEEEKVNEKGDSKGIKQVRLMPGVLPDVLINPWRPVLS